MIFCCLMFTTTYLKKNVPLIVGRIVFYVYFWPNFVIFKIHEKHDSNNLTLLCSWSKSSETFSF